MDISTRITEIKDYFVTMKVEPSENTQLIYVIIKLPTKWSVSDDTIDLYKVNVTLDDASERYFFWTDISVGFDAVFDAIEYNIKLNVDAQKKAEIYKRKVEELKAFFIDEKNDVESLEKIEFVIKKRQSRKGDIKTNALETIPAELETEEVINE